MFKFNLLNTFLENTLMCFNKTLYLTEGQGQLKEKILIIVGWVKGTHPTKAKWIEVGKVREKYPHLFNN